MQSLARFGRRGIGAKPSAFLFRRLAKAQGSPRNGPPHLGHGGFVDAFTARIPMARAEPRPELLHPSNVEARKVAPPPTGTKERGRVALKLGVSCGRGFWDLDGALKSLLQGAYASV
ncbi:hypothetical protein S40285_09888 [Stachybotrys chlorohalonatus IBT 40285]|uniref:Uncharacterized protein n=1 Tax=Stachybotrys chlorohalonatus (strain IBT 40285) TaxID=1283841 RepID=A0A084QKL6_STAC4|nr:hypothetical protein S40285_09888 [Stachybotrys chlorohalonata IBT 40285]